MIKGSATESPATRWWLPSFTGFFLGFLFFVLIFTPSLVPRPPIFQGLLGGLAFGLLFQASAPAIIAYYVLPTVVAIVVSIVNALEDIARWIDTGQTLAPLVEGTPSGTEWARVATSIALWVLLPLALGLWRLPRSEVK